MIFKKLDLVLPPLDFELIKGDPYDAYGTEFFAFHINDKDYLEQILKDRIKFNISPDIVTYNEVPNGTSAHSHKHNEISLNYYINSSIGSATLFFEPKISAAEVDLGRILPDGSVTESTIVNYNIAQLKLIDKFCARSGDAYLLDVGQVHAVARLYKTTRKILRWLWFGYTIEEILESIEILPQT